MRKNKILYFTILSIISFLVCRCTLQEKKNSYEDTPMVDFDRDSVFYQLDIKEDRLNTKENTLLTREVVVEDSIFGGKENRDNWNRAFAYSDMLRKTKGEITTYSPRYLYKIFLYEKEAYKKIISFEADLNSTIILRQGESDNFFNNESEKCSFDSSRYLRITQVLPENINCKSINLAYKEGEWYVFSTEELKIDYTKKLSYCIDSFSCIPAKYYNTEGTMYDNCLDCDNN
ncbi:hypothetical protein [Capnocytophaga gingivalis]|uniref:hypothetical protein n=1 Tax=Capnocytophaga gingivalis TaxID=1017 RepID=UPI002B4721C1|nr:hypothetical protein [Capnocytophaga gingivalis]MEB3014547.1 hypothetical protein [Capnocytophaga gingivalis]